MENQFREHLLDGEELLWTGRPESFDTFDKTNRNSIIAGLVIKVIIVLGLLLTLLSIKEIDIKQICMFGFVIAITLFSMLNPFLIAGRLRKRTLYGLTNKRILRAGTNDVAVPYTRIKSARLGKDPDGHTTLLCGERAIHLKPKQWRGEADAFFIDSLSEPEAERVILYALPMNRDLTDLLRKYLPLK